MWASIVGLLVCLGGVHCGSFREDQERLVEEFALAITDRIKQVKQNHSWECDCSYHECGRGFQGNPECINSRAPEDERTCPPQGGCTPIGVREGVSQQWP